ncbi:hypothetical protein RhiirA4_456290 [Rhizophagus irregularis]|uniref:Uncharacterized protein n=1 Tax=Rhizophagus irregularis TaxID=588596 RepID=A0A2I1G755_9GLOM|nr:hypothetical protein RhiirA4_456290 [Rhizophagus irregularis]
MDQLVNWKKLPKMAFSLITGHSTPESRYFAKIGGFDPIPPELNKSYQTKKDGSNLITGSQNNCKISPDTIQLIRVLNGSGQILLQIKTVNFDEVPSAMIITSLYIPTSSSTPSTLNNTISEEYIIVENRRYSMDYLTGPGVPEWHLNENSIQWIVDDINITKICHEYHAVVIKKCKLMKVTLSATEEL